MRHWVYALILAVASLGSPAQAHAQDSQALAVGDTPAKALPSDSGNDSTSVKVESLKAQWKAEAPAQPKTPWLRPTREATSPGSTGAWRAALSLLLLAALVTVVWFARQRGQRSRAGSSLGNIRILGSTRIGPKAQVLVAEVAGHTYLIGVTEHSITRLGEVGEAAPRSTGKASEEPDPAIDDIPLQGPARFAQMLKSALHPSQARGSRAPSETLARETEDVLSTRSTVSSSRRPQRWNMDEQASGLFSQLNNP